MKDWKSLERHPLSAEYEDLVGDRWDGLVKSIEDGFDQNRPIMLACDGEVLKVVDGWQRQRACIACDVKPVYQELLKSEDLEAYVAMVNDYRRHESETQKERRLAAKKARVVKARDDEHKSFREIGEEEGISHTQAKRDYDSAKTQEKAVSGGTHVPPDHGNHQAQSREETKKTTGLDGKTYSATKPAKPLCGRCTRAARVGQKPPKDCEMCRELQGRTRKPQAAKPEPEDKPVDAFGNELPKNCRAAYLDPWIQKAIDAIAVIEEQLRKEQLAAGMNRRAKHYPFFNAKDFVDGVGMAQNTLDQLIEHLKENRPAGVCPSCAGKGCADCKLSGLVPRELYAKLKKKAS